LCVRLGNDSEFIDLSNLKHDDEKTWVAAIAVYDLMGNEVTGIDVDDNIFAFYRINSSDLETSQI
jgi:hypothetical protein